MEAQVNIRQMENELLKCSLPKKVDWLSLPLNLWEGSHRLVNQSLSFRNTSPVWSHSLNLPYRIKESKAKP